MRRIKSPYIYNIPEWPKFSWDEGKVAELLIPLRHQQGRLRGKMEMLGFDLQEEAVLNTLTLDVTKSSEIEGEILDSSEVRSSVARKLGIDISGLVPSDRQVDGVVEMLLDATQNFKDPLTKERLFAWHAALFPNGRSGMHKIVVGNWRDNSLNDPMQVVSGALGKEKVHFQAPDSVKLEKEMKAFLNWFNTTETNDPVIKAAIAHLWFVTIHPFDDGNGRIARALTDLQLARAENSSKRFYSMSAQIRKERKGYYEILERTQKGTLDITVWLLWFLKCLQGAIEATENILGATLVKVRFWEKYQAVDLNSRQKLMINKIFDGFEGNITSTKWAKINKCSQDTANRDINDLIKKGILQKDVAGGRSTNYLLVKGFY